MLWNRDRKINPRFGIRRTYIYTFVSSSSSSYSRALMNLPRSSSSHFAESPWNFYQFLFSADVAPLVFLKIPRTTILLPYFSVVLSLSPLIISFLLFHIFHFLIRFLSFFFIRDCPSSGLCISGPIRSCLASSRVLFLSRGLSTFSLSLTSLSLFFFSRPSDH